MSLVVLPGRTAAVARAIQARLNMAFPPARFAHAWMPAKMSEKVWTDLLRSTPFVGLGWSANRATTASGRIFNGDFMFDVYLVVKNELGLEGRLFGDRFGPGLMQMADAAVAVLNGFTLPNVGTLVVSAASNAFADGLGDDKAIAAISVCVKGPLGVGDIFEGPELCGDQITEFVWSWHIDGTLTGDVIVDDIILPGETAPCA